MVDRFWFCFFTFFLYYNLNVMTYPFQKPPIFLALLHKSSSKLSLLCRVHVSWKLWFSKLISNWISFKILKRFKHISSKCNIFVESDLENSMNICWGKSYKYIVDNSIIYDFHSTASTNIHWIFNFPRFFLSVWDRFSPYIKVHKTDSLTNWELHQTLTPRLCPQQLYLIYLLKKNKHI